MVNGSTLDFFMRPPEFNYLCYTKLIDCFLLLIIDFLVINETYIPAETLESDFCCFRLKLQSSYLGVLTVNKLLLIFSLVSPLCVLLICWMVFLEF